MKKDDKSYSETVDMVGYRESCKLFFDFFKHLTTLSTGSLVLITTLLTKVFNEVSRPRLVLNSMGGFVVTILLCVFAMFITASHIQGKKEGNRSAQTLMAIALLLSGLAFVGSLSCLVWFGSINFDL